jgi:hypothetical protein
LQLYHLRLGERKEHTYGEQTSDIAAELAIHFEQGRNAYKAIRYLQQAGQRAVERSANSEAMAYFSKGLAWLKTLPDSSQRTQHELSLQLAMGVPLVATKGVYCPRGRNHIHTSCRTGTAACRPFSALLCPRWFVGVLSGTRRSRNSKTVNRAIAHLSAEHPRS